VLSDRRGLPITPSHDCDALTKVARHTTILSHASIWGTVSAVRDTRDGVRGVLQLLRLWSVLSVGMPEQTNVLGVRAVEVCSGNGFFPVYAAELGACSTIATL
jgi:hypothetical protein